MYRSRCCLRCGLLTTTLVLLAGPSPVWSQGALFIDGFETGRLCEWSVIHTGDHHGPCCIVDLDCDDLSDCTSESCSAETSLCGYTAEPLGTPCDDGQLCTMNDACNGVGDCGGEPAVCGADFACPVADAGEAQTVDADSPFHLDGSATTNPQSVALQYVWTWPTGSPTLTAADSLYPSGTATICGPHTYTLTVSEPCGNTSTDGVTVTLLANGSRVSNTTCSPSLECGTVDYPWCTIQAGIDNSAVSPVAVAGVAGQPYVENPIMTDGTDVLGGYESSFTAPRNPDPETNGTAVFLDGPPLMWPATVTAVLDGFTVGLVDSVTGPGTNRTGIQVLGSAHASLLGIRMVDHLTGPVLGSSTGLVVSDGLGGSVIVDNSTIRAPEASESSTGILVDGMTDGLVSVTETDIFSASGGVRSEAVRHLGEGTLSITGGTVAGGPSTPLSKGVSANQPGSVVHLTNVTVRGGGGSQTVGVDVRSIASLEIAGGSIAGGGGDGPIDSAIGIAAADIGEIVVDGATVVGSAPSGLSPWAAAAYGIEITASPATLPGPVTVTASTVTGGDDADIRIGIRSGPVPLTVELSDVAGSRTSGGVRAVGVSLGGTSPMADVVIIDNPSITGGAPQSSPVGVPYSALGLELSTAMPTLVDGNTLIQGCSPSCNGPGNSPVLTAIAAGISLESGTSYVISNNETIRGGPHDGPTPWTWHTGIAAQQSGVLATNTSLSAVSNGLVVGNDDQNGQPAEVSGIFGTQLDLTAHENTLILGGYGEDVAAGILVLDPETGVNLVSLDRNRIAAGGAGFARAIDVSGAELTATANVVDGCGLEPALPSTPPTACVAAVESHGIFSENNPMVSLRNNYVFGGFASLATGVEIDAPDASEVVVAYNLCLAQGQNAGPGGLTLATGLRISEKVGPPEDYYFVNNIFGAGDRAFIRYGVDESGVQTHVTFGSNDFIPDTEVTHAAKAYYNHSVLGELDTAAAINGLLSAPDLLYGGNLTIDPVFASGADPNAPTAAGYHLDPTCALKNLGEVCPHEEKDYDAEDRDVGSTPTAFPEIGPDECDFGGSPPAY